MKRIRIIGLALVAVFALAAVVASAASASTFKANPTSKKFPAPIAGTGGEQKFKAGFGTVTCKEAASTGSALSGAEQTTIEKVEYKNGCKDTVGDSVAEPIVAEYELKAERNASKEGQLNIVNKPIVIKIGGFANCTITVLDNKEGQGVLAGLTYENSKAKTELTVKSKTTGIKQTGSGGFCTTGTGEYTGSVTGKLTGGGELFWEE
jgi:hypothetical protein